MDDAYLIAVAVQRSARRPMPAARGEDAWESTGHRSRRADFEPEQAEIIVDAPPRSGFTRQSATFRGAAISGDIALELSDDPRQVLEGGERRDSIQAHDQEIAYFATLNSELQAHILIIAPVSWATCPGLVIGHPDATGSGPGSWKTAI
ncbi:hypothetical protein ACU4GR_08930 (plasmid) [Methylobacterium oryzae CBMB20]